MALRLPSCGRVLPTTLRLLKTQHLETKGNKAENGTVSPAPQAPGTDPEGPGAHSRCPESRAPTGPPCFHTFRPVSCPRLPPRFRSDGASGKRKCFPALWAVARLEEGRAPQEPTCAAALPAAQTS